MKDFVKMVDTRLARSKNGGPREEENPENVVVVETNDNPESMSNLKRKDSPLASMQEQTSKKRKTVEDLEKEEVDEVNPSSPANDGLRVNKTLPYDDQSPAQAPFETVADTAAVLVSMSSECFLQDVGTATEAIKPEGMHFTPSQYQTQIRIGTRCHVYEAVTTILNLVPGLTGSEKLWFEDHPQFKHIFHMKREKTHKLQGMWMLLLRNAKIDKKKEAWFIVNGVPIRYGIREHALISGLDCRNYPLGYKDFGSKALVERHFPDGSIRLEDVKAKLLEMGPHRDRLKIAVLYFLSSVICARTKVGDGAKPVLDFFQRAANDLELCKTFPWGRLSFDYMLDSIKSAMNHFGGKANRNALWTIPGFCLPMEILAFEAIHKLGESFREAVPGADATCPRMCKYKFKPCDMTGFPLSAIYKALDQDKEIDSIIPTRSVEEEDLLDGITEEEDDVDKPDLAVDSWMKRLGERLPVYFEDMYQEDVAARVVQHKVDLPVITGSDSIGMADLMNEVKQMRAQLKIIEKKVDKLEKKLDKKGTIKL